MRAVESRPGAPFVETQAPRGLWAYRLAALAMLAGCGWYLVWRVSAHTIPPSAVGWAWFAVECASCVMGALVTALCFHGVERVPIPLSALSPGIEARALPSIDVFVPTLDEPLDVVARTVLAALAAPYAGDKRVYVLDDGARPAFSRWVADRAAAGAKVAYVARDKPPGVPHFAKSGNLNHALWRAETAGDLVLLLDADHVPEPAIFETLVPYFFERDDPRGACRMNRVGYVVCPDRSWTTRGGNPLFDDVRVFAGPIQQANDALGSVWLTGNAVLMRRDALRDTQGFWQGSIAEDVPTGFLMIARGWQSRFHSRPLTRGMPPVSLAAALKQRERWAIGEWQHYSGLLPSLWAGLGWRPRFSYAYGALVKVASGFCFYGYALVPLVSVLAGGALKTADPVDDALHLGVYVLVTRLHILVLGRSLPAKSFFRMEQMTFIANAAMLAAAIRVALRLETRRFWVSPKQARRVGGHPGYWFMAIATAVPLVWAVVTLANGLAWPTHPTLPGAGRWLGLAWQLNFAMLLWPMFGWAVRPPRVVADYHEEPLEEPARGGALGWLARFALPTNLAPALTLVLCIGTLVEQPVGPNAHVPPARYARAEQTREAAPGSIVWRELVAHDLAAAIKFYGRVVGWTVDEHDGYATWRTPRGPVAGLIAMAPEVKAKGVPPSWIFTVSTRDVGAVSARAEARGGHVYERAAFTPEGSYALLGDALGTAIYVSDAAAPEPPLRPAPGDVSLVDLGTSNLADALAFYGPVFGWSSLAKTRTPAGVYDVLGKPSRAIAGVYAQPGSAHRWTVYIEVEHLDAAVDEALAAGGTSVVSAFRVPYGRQAVMRDDEGALFGLRERRRSDVREAENTRGTWP